MSTQTLARPEGRIVRTLFRTYGLWLDIGMGYALPLCSFSCDTRESGTPDAPVFRTVYRPRTWPAGAGTAQQSRAARTTPRIMVAFMPDPFPS